MQIKECKQTPVNGHASESVETITVYYAPQSQIHLAPTAPNLLKLTLIPGTNASKYFNIEWGGNLKYFIVVSGVSLGYFPLFGFKHVEPWSILQVYHDLPPQLT